MMRPTRVLHLGKYYPPERGGIETVLEAVCKGAGPAIEARALVLNTARATVHENVDGVPVTRVGRVAAVGAVSMTPSLPLWLRRERADVVVLHEPNPMALVAYALARPSAPLVVWFHSEVIRARWKYRLFYEPLLDWVLARAARIIVAAPPMRDVPALACHRDKVVVIPYGLDPKGYPDGAAPPEDRRARADAALRRPARAPTRAWTCCCAPWSACRRRSSWSGTDRCEPASKDWPATSASTTACAFSGASVTPSGWTGIAAPTCSCCRR